MAGTYKPPGGFGTPNLGKKPLTEKDLRKGSKEAPPTSTSAPFAAVDQATLDPTVSTLKTPSGSSKSKRHRLTVAILETPSSRPPPDPCPPDQQPIADIVEKKYGTEILGSFLPKIIINRVSLETKDSDSEQLRGQLEGGGILEDFYDRNPHIDLGVAKFFPRAQLASAIRAAQQPSGLNIAIDFEARQVETNLPFSVFDTDEIRKALKIKLFLVKENIDVYNALSQEGARYVNNWNENTTVHTVLWSDVINRMSTSPNSESRAKFRKIQEDGKTTIVYPFVVDFMINNTEPDVLGVIAYSYFDLSSGPLADMTIKEWVRTEYAPPWTEAGKSRVPIFIDPDGVERVVPKDEDGFDLVQVTSQRKGTQSQRNSLLIIDDGQISSTSHVFLDSKNRQWDGPVHWHPPEKIKRTRVVPRQTDVIGSVGTPAPGGPIVVSPATETSIQIIKGWMTGPTLGHAPGEAQLLSRVPVATSKVQDFRTSGVVESFQFDFSIVENDIFPNLNKSLYLQEKRIDINKQKSYFSDIFLSRDEEDHCRFFFSMDWKKILIENSIFGKLFKDQRDINELLQKCKIISMKMFRVRVEGSGEAGSKPRKLSPSLPFDPPVKPKLFDENQVDEVLFVTKQKEGGTRIDAVDDRLSTTTAEGQFILKHGRKDGTSFEEISLMPLVPGLRHFQGTDRDIANKSDGYYQYKVEIEVLETSVDLVIKRLNTLLSHIKGLKIYYDEATRLLRKGGVAPYTSPYVDLPHNEEKNYERGQVEFGNYNTKTKSFSQEFIETYTDETLTLKNVVYNGGKEINLANAISNAGQGQPGFVQILELFSSNWDPNFETQITNTLLDYLNPILATPESINVVIGLMETAANKIQSIVKVVKKERYTGSTPVFDGAGNAPDGPRPPSAKNRSFKIEKKFSSIFNANLPSHLGFDFLFTTLRGNEALAHRMGLKIIKKEHFQAQADHQANWIWKDATDISAPDPTDRTSWWNGTNNVNITKATYFSPAVILLPDGDRIHTVGNAHPSVDFLKPLSYSLHGSMTSVDFLRRIGISKRVLGEWDKEAARQWRPKFSYDDSLVPEKEFKNPKKYVLANDLASYFSTHHSVEIVNPDNKMGSAYANHINETVMRAGRRGEAYEAAESYGSFYYKTTISETKKQRDLAYDFLFTAIKQTEFDPNNQREIPAPSSYMGIENYDLTKPGSKIRRAIESAHGSGVFAKLNELRDAPLQTKSLIYYNIAANRSLTKAGDPLARVAPIYDNLSDTSKFCEFVYRTQIINRVEALTGYSTLPSGDPILGKPIWEPMGDPTSAESILNRGGFAGYLCRSIPYTNETLGITRNKNFDLPTYDEHFILEAAASATPFVVPPTPTTPAAAPGMGAGGLGGMADPTRGMGESGPRRLVGAGTAGPGGLGGGGTGGGGYGGGSL